MLSKEEGMADDFNDSSGDIEHPEEEDMDIFDGKHINTII